MKKRVCLLVTLLALVIMGFTMNVEAAEIIDRGYCGGEGDGTNLTWTLDGDGVLVIEGQGKMKDLSSTDFEEDSSPTEPIWWHKYSDSIDSVIVKYGVTSIGNWAFNSTSLNSIVLPESLTSIGDRAFYDCRSLVGIDLPKSLVDLGQRAFEDCVSLYSIVLPESMTQIERYTFFGCEGLSRITIPLSIKRICEGAFLRTSLGHISFDGTKAQWNDIEIYTSAMNRIYGYYDGILNADIGYGDYDYKKLEDFVSRLYRNFLKREPDEKGLADWIDALVSGRGTGAKVVAGFVLSPEYKANSLSNEGYVTALYNIIFNREPDEEGLNSWIGVIENGCTIKKILAGFVNSEEFNILCSDLKIARGTYNSDEIADQNVKIAAFVARLYKICLERVYEQEGLNNWVNALVDRTMNGSSVVLGFFGSQEFENRDLDDESFIAIAYRAIFGREPDPNGLRSWIDALAKGKTREDVLRGFLKSEEFDNLCKEYRIASGNARKVKDMDYIFPSGEMIYGAMSLSDRELKLAKNEIYARRGYIFNDSEMAEYFAKKEWYKPSISAKDFDEGIFNQHEWDGLQDIFSEEVRRANEKATLSEKECIIAEIERFINAAPAEGFLYSTFSEPVSDVNLWDVVNQIGKVGIDDEIFKQEVRKVLYLPYDGFYYMDSDKLDEYLYRFHSINSDKLDELLYRFTGYGLYERRWDLSEVDYLKSLDTYYIVYKNTIMMDGLRVKEMKSLGNNIYEVKTEPYPNDWTDAHHFRTIRLKRFEPGGYQFISVQ